jgi:pyruvate formate lyase activating enzyme
MFNNGFAMMNKEAMFYDRQDGKVKCYLCPHNCIIKEGFSGVCNVRRNSEGKLVSDNYGILSAVNFDPIEKKPLYHFYPGSLILSLGSYGCNMKCKCCQNWQISQATVKDFTVRNSYMPQDMLRIAKSRSNNIGVAYTYNEPTVWYEFMLETAKLFQSAGLKNAIVSNGFINEEPLLELLKYIDAFNIDLKAFNDRFYKEVSSAKLEPVKNTLKIISEHKKHLEITNLVIPGLNDNEDEFKSMVEWIASELGVNTVLHLSRYHPMYRMNIESTSSLTLERLYKIAAGILDYVFVGNINLKDYQDTKCSKCKNTVISRSGYFIEKSGIDKDGKCIYCGNLITAS